MMKAYDLTHTISHTMTIDDGVEAPIMEVEGSVLNGDRYQCTTIRNLMCHVGTHMDCDSHMLPSGFTTDTKDVSFFMGKGIALDATGYPEGGEIGPEILEGKSLDGISFVLFWMGWDKYWPDREKFYGNYPVLSMELIEYLGKHPDIKGVGIEPNSFDRKGDAAQPRHVLFLGYGKMIVECLTNLDQLTGKDFIFSALPLKLENGEGSPVRAVAICL